jgi:hypothetical protein
MTVLIPNPSAYAARPAQSQQIAIAALDTNNYPVAFCVLSEPEAVNATAPSRRNP